jgi:hypothetical protein
MFFFKYVPLHSQTPDTALVTGGREGVIPKHVIRNFFLLKLVTLDPTDTFSVLFPPLYLKTEAHSSFQNVIFYNLDDGQSPREQF